VGKTKPKGGRPRDRLYRDLSIKPSQKEGENAPTAIEELENGKPLVLGGGGVGLVRGKAKTGTRNPTRGGKCLKNFSSPSRPGVSSAERKKSPLFIRENWQGLGRALSRRLRRRQPEKSLDAQTKKHKDFKTHF